MNIFPLILQIAALICLGLAAFPKSWGWWGLFLWLFSLMVSGIVLHPVQ